MAKRGRPRTQNPSKAGWRHRTRQAYPIEGKRCESCGKPAQVRHHRDGDVRNLAPSNIAFLCRACHVERDPRIKPHDVNNSDVRNGDAALIAERVRKLRPFMSERHAEERALRELTQEGKLNA